MRMNEYLLTQMLTGASTGGQFLPVAVVVIMFLVMIYKPDRIRSRPLFRWATSLYAAGVIVSPAVQMASMLTQFSSTTGSFGRSRADSSIWLSLGMSFGPMMMGIGLLLAFMSLSVRDPNAPSPRSPNVGPAPAPTPPKRHPLD